MNVQKLPRAIGTLGLVFVLFFSTSGGPYTTETLIYSVGPGLGLLILALVPLVWSVPEALIVGELASMLPEEGGYYRWVDRAFGCHARLLRSIAHHARCKRLDRVE